MTMCLHDATRAGYLVAINSLRAGAERATYLEVFLGESAAELLHAGPVHSTQSLLAAAVVAALWN